MKLLSLRPLWLGLMILPVACGSDATPPVDAAVGADTPATTDMPVANDTPSQPDVMPPPPDGRIPPPPDGMIPPPPDGMVPPPDAMAPPDAVTPPTDATAPTDVTTPTDAASCARPGTPTTPTPPTVASATSDFNVTLLSCTRTAVELACTLGTAHQFTSRIDGAVRRLEGNGVVNHDVGAFPNPGNPNVISAQRYAFTVPVTPSGTGRTLVQMFGISITGAVFDPGTAETWNDNGSWRYEALRYGTAPPYFATGGTDTTRHPTALGLDCNFAHVQPTGSYHYHGIPTGIVPATPALTFVGWAADGYPIFGRWDYSTATDPTSALREMRSSYRLRSGTRPSGTAGPGGAYDGTFGQDWEYAAGTGDLDECNGRTGMVPIDGTVRSSYHYVLTNTFPYIPRCWHAAPDASFTMGMMGMPGDAGVPPADGGMTGTPRACTSTAGCTGACPAGSMGCTCANSPMGMICVPSCNATSDCPASPDRTLMCNVAMHICVPAMP